MPAGFTHAIVPLALGGHDAERLPIVYVAGSPVGRRGSTTAEQEDLDASVSTLVIGRVTFQVIQRPATEAQRSPSTRRHADPSAVHQVLPGTGHAVDWPPRRVLGEDDLNEFVTPHDFSARTWEPLPRIPRPQDS